MCVGELQQRVLSRICTWFPFDSLTLNGEGNLNTFNLLPQNYFIFSDAARESLFFASRGNNHQKIIAGNKNLFNFARLN